MLKLTRSDACKNAPLRMRKYTFDNMNDYTVKEAINKIFTFDEFKFIDRDCELIFIKGTLYIMIPGKKTIEVSLANFAKGRVEEHFMKVQRSFI